MTLAEYALFAFSSVFAIADPIASVPAFIAMTVRDTTAYRLRMALTACIVPWWGSLRDSCWWARPSSIFAALPSR